MHIFVLSFFSLKVLYIAVNRWPRYKLFILLPTRRDKPFYSISHKYILNVFPAHNTQTHTDKHTYINLNKSHIYINIYKTYNAFKYVVGILP